MLHVVLIYTYMRLQYFQVKYKPIPRVRMVTECKQEITKPFQSQILALLAVQCATSSELNLFCTSAFPVVNGSSGCLFTPGD